MARKTLQTRENCSSALPFVVIGIISLAAGAFHSSSGALALGVVFVGGPLLVRWALGRSLRSLSVRRSVPESAYEGDSIEVRFEIENRGRLPVFFPEAHEIFSPEIHTQKDVLFAERLSAGETLTRSYHGDCLLPRGIYRIGPTAISISDPFGWYRLEKSLDARVLFKVYPRIQDARVGEHHGESLSRVLDAFERPQLGDSNEFLSVREYRVGDPLRRVHWRLTAHRGFPVVRECARPSTGDLTVFVDTFQKALTGVGRTSSLEYGVRIAAALAARACRGGHRVSVVAGEARGQRVDTTQAGVGLQRVLDLLVRMRPTGEQRLTELLATEDVKLRPGTTAVLPLSPYLYDDPLLDNRLAGWRRRGVRIVGIIFDAQSFQSLWTSSASNRPSSSAEQFAARLHRLAVESVIVRCGDDISQVIREERAS